MRFQRRNRGEEKGCPQIESAATARYCNVVQRTVPVPGLKCTGTGKAWVLYPDDGAQHPLVSFAHGANTAWNVTAWMPQLLYGLAARGYVVVATEGIGNAHCLETSIVGQCRLFIAYQYSGVGLVNQLGAVLAEGAHTQLRLHLPCGM